MFLSTGLPTRRKFLERSVLGAGSVLFLPGLLTSCTDHNIPSPGSPPISPPLLGDDDTNWNDRAKIIVTTGLEMLPEVGEILSALVEVFWPANKPDVWDQVKDQVEKLINQKLDTDKYNTVKGNLDGLEGVATNYLNAIKNNSDIKTNWIDLRNDFSLYLPNFKQQGYELLLLPLFAQFMNMYVSVLRDGILHGSEWGMAPGDVYQAGNDLIDLTTQSTNWVSKIYEDGETNLINTPRNDHNCEPFRTLNAYRRQMQLTVLDYQLSWDYYNPIFYPNGGKVVLTREIYSDPYGTCDDSGDIKLPTPPTQLPTNLTVWGYDRIDAVQLTYPAGSGPGGVTTTPRMGDQPDGNGFGGSNQPPYGGIFSMSPDNPITKVRAIYDTYFAYGDEYGPVVTGMQFEYYNGPTTNVCGNENLNSITQTNDTGLFGYSYEALSSIHINGINKFMKTADCVVFGFQYWTPPAATLRALQAIYVTSPKEHSAADFAKSFPKLAIPADLITDELKAARRKHWASIEARVKALK